MTGNKFEDVVFTKHPYLKSRIENIEDREKFEIMEDQITLEAIYTPGHTDDHVSFAITKADVQEKYLVVGDIILGTPSAAMDDLLPYMNSLEMLQSM